MLNTGVYYSMYLLKKKIIASYLILALLFHQSKSADISVSSSAETKPEDDYKLPPTLEEGSIILELFGSAKNLNGVWDKKPVYLPSSMKSLASHTKDMLPFITPNEHNSKDYNSSRFSHLFDINSSLSIIAKNPNLVHGTDYFILKYIIRDGEEFNGQLPQKSLPVEVIPRLLQEDAFSFVINDLHKYWKPVRNYARALAAETNAPSISCNMYITPAGLARGFETHMDWMDVIVLQVSGEKTWSVFDEAMINLVPPDQKKKPTSKDLLKNTFRNVILRPGDALYIPRGYLHNATSLEDGDASLHLTFGINYGSEGTIESLLHHALKDFVNRYDSDSYHAHSCENGRIIRVDQISHYSISELARRVNCGGFGEYSTLNEEHLCLLRAFLPMHPTFQELDGRTDKETELQFQLVLDSITQHASVEKAIEFMNNLVLNNKQEVRTLGSVPYRYEGMTQDEPFQCVLSSDQMKNIDESYREFFLKFTQYAKSRFTETRSIMEATIEKNRRFRMQLEDSNFRLSS
jgi:hypothetical protein